MRWQGRRQSDNIEDRRAIGASGSGGFGASGMLRLLPIAFRLLGVKGTMVLLVGFVAVSFFTGNLGGLLTGLGLQQETTVREAAAPFHESAEEKKRVQFVSVILADTEDTWSSIFKEAGRTYKAPRLVLFRDSVNSACGMAQSAMGPFYCPGDQKVYIDLGFYDQLRSRYNAPGDVAQAYVIAHEVGHHVQTLLGISQKVHAAKKKLDKMEANQLSVKLELQADCLAGVWAYHADHARQMLEAGDVEAGLAAASAIGDDTLQKQSRGYVTPDSFTHGTSEQRVKWFKTGLNSGEIGQCNTFGN